jgi:hypothetical protein
MTFSLEGQKANTGEKITIEGLMETSLENSYTPVLADAESDFGFDLSSPRLQRKPVLVP